MGLFGKDLFGKKLQSELYDFAQHGLIRGNNHYGIELVEYAVEVPNPLGDNQEAIDAKIKKQKAKKAKEPTPKTPKEVFQLGSLQENDFVLVTDKAYIEKQIAILEKKRDLLPEAKKVRNGRGRGNRIYEEVTDSYGASKYGRAEVQSIIDRLRYRLKFEQHKEFFDQFPYTTSARINEVLNEHKNLRSKRVEEFIPDMPEEAVDKMTAYTAEVKKLTGKVAVYYIIADKKDFGEIDKKRDPILLAQTPFALGWQVLGAWDEEMVYLGDL